MITYPDILDVTTNWQSQEVTLILPDSLTDELLLKIVRHLKYHSYDQN